MIVEKIISNTSNFTCILCENNISVKEIERNISLTVYDKTVKLERHILHNPTFYIFTHTLNFQVIRGLMSRMVISLGGSL